MSFFAADTINIENRRLNLNGFDVPLDNSGYLVPNFRARSAYYSKTRAMYRVIKNSINGKTIKRIKEGDIVYIIPLLYTGNSDFKAFPTGRAPGGFIHVSMIDSVLNGRWLKQVAFGEAIVLLMILFVQRSV